MALDRDQERLRDKALRMLGECTVADTVVQRRAIIGPEVIPDSERMAHDALEKMRRGEPPAPEEMTALAIVIRILRPVLLSRDCALPELPRDEQHDLHSQEMRDRWDAFRTRARPFVCSIGRVQTASRDHIGSGFLVSDGLLATNRHVLDALTFGSGELPTHQHARVLFTGEDGRPEKGSDFADILGVAALHPTLDVVVLRVEQHGRPPVPLSSERIVERMPVVVIGFPAEDDQNPVFLAPVFDGIFGCKRAAIGEVLEGLTPNAFAHDCSTTQGNSGSPVLSLLTGEAIGIHRAGHFMYRNEAVPVSAWQSLLQSVKRGAVT